MNETTCGNDDQISHGPQPNNLPTYLTLPYLIQYPALNRCPFTDQPSWPFSLSLGSMRVAARRRGGDKCTGNRNYTREKGGLEPCSCDFCQFITVRSLAGIILSYLYPRYNYSVYRISGERLDDRGGQVSQLGVE